jgi:periplasmic divalent cation tolerance protein
VKEKRAPVLATTTTTSIQDARKISAALIEQRLAACVQIVEPITSVYRWQGEVEEESEVLLLIKSTQELVPRIAELLDRIHPYDVPELIATPVVAGSQDYLDWLKENVNPAGA